MSWLMWDGYNSVIQRMQRKERDQVKSFHGDEMMALRYYEVLVTSALPLDSVTELTTLLASLH